MKQSYFELKVKNINIYDEEDQIGKWTKQHNIIPLSSTNCCNTDLFLFCFVFFSLSLVSIRRENEYTT